MLNKFNDDDMRIAPEDLSQLNVKENLAADDNIDLFMRQRAIGNTNRARKLGEKYVADLVDCVWTKTPEGLSQEIFEKQLKILYAYSVHRAIETYSPNHIVADAALGSFYERLEEADPVLFNEINESPAFSMYLFLHRSMDECAKTVGNTFASLCETKGFSDCEIIGESAYSRFMGACLQRILTAGYAE